MAASPPEVYVAGVAETPLGEVPDQTVDGGAGIDVVDAGDAMDLTPQRAA